MSMIGVLPTLTKSRNGAQARKWVLAQSYNIDAAASDQNTTEATLLDIVANATSRQVALVASNRSATPKVFDAIMADNPNESICNRLAANPSCPGGILSTLAYKYIKNSTILAKIAANPSLPVTVLTTMVPDINYKKDQWVIELTPYKQAVLNPSTPVEAVVKSLKFMKTDELRLKTVQKRKQEIVEYLDDVHGIQLANHSTDYLCRTATAIK